MAEIIVHHLERSRSSRVLWLLEELGLSYEIKEYARNPETMRATAELEEVHPLGKAPVVTVDGISLAESGAILEHIVEELGDGQLCPERGTEAHRRYRFFMHYAEGSLTPPLLVKLITTRLREAKLPFFAKPIARGVASKIDSTYTDAEIAKHLGFVEAELADRDYFCGDELTAADIQMSFPAEGAASANAPLAAKYPNLAGWLDRIRARPAHKRAIERGGPLLPERPE